MKRNNDEMDTEIDAQREAQSYELRDNKSAKETAKLRDVGENKE
jgi:hypothetical protein